jgi:hypothetical protein
VRNFLRPAAVPHSSDDKTDVICSLVLRNSGFITINETYCGSFFCPVGKLIVFSRHYLTKLQADGTQAENPNSFQVQFGLSSEPATVLYDPEAIHHFRNEDGSYMDMVGYTLPKTFPALKSLIGFMPKLNSVKKTSVKDAVVVGFRQYGKYATFCTHPITNALYTAENNTSECEVGDASIVTHCHTLRLSGNSMIKGDCGKVVIDHANQATFLVGMYHSATILYGYAQCFYQELFASFDTRTPHGAPGMEDSLTEPRFRPDVGACPILGSVPVARGSEKTSLRKACSLKK